MYFHLHANISITKGKKRSLISDLYNQTSFIIPNSLAIFIKKSEKKSETEILNFYGVENSSTVKEYLKWLSNKAFIEWFEDEKTLSYFPRLNTNWTSPFSLTNIIIDVNLRKHNWINTIKQISNLKIPILQIRFYSNCDFNHLDAILLHTKFCYIKGIEIILPYDDSFTFEILEKLLLANTRIFQIQFYRATENIVDSVFLEKYSVKVMYTASDFISSSNCGVVNENYFNTNMDLHNEGLKHNTCLNRKISIDQNGVIKNCPSMVESFGNIRDTTLEEALNKEGFKKYWNITKDQINMCKDCEFRNVCTDCRAYIQDPNDVYSKPLKCGYDPYTNVWEDWSTNPLSKKAIEHYGMQDLVKKPTL